MLPKTLKSKRAKVRQQDFTSGCRTCPMKPSNFDSLTDFLSFPFILLFYFNLVGFFRRTKYFLALSLYLYFFHFSFEPPQNKSRLLIYPEIITLVYFRTYFRVSTSIDSLVGSIRNLRVDLSLGFRFHFFR